MIRRTVTLFACAIGLSLGAQDEKRISYDFSFGATYTQMKHMSIRDDQYSSNGDYSSRTGEIENKYDVTVGMGIIIQSNHTIYFKTGAFISGASAFGPKDIYYDGISYTDRYWKTETLKYHLYLLEFPAEIGFRISKRYPLRISAGICIGAVAYNDTRWSYMQYFNRELVDSFGNYYTVADSTYVDKPIANKGLAAATSAELEIPILKFHDSWVRLNLGVNSYFTSTTTMTYSNVEHVDLMRIKHNTYYVRINIPLSFGFNSSRLPEGDPYPPTIYH